MADGQRKTIFPEHIYVISNLFRLNIIYTEADFCVIFRTPWVAVRPVVPQDVSIRFFVVISVKVSATYTVKLSFIAVPGMCHVIITQIWETLVM